MQDQPNETFYVCQESGVEIVEDAFYADHQRPLVSAGVHWRSLMFTKAGLAAGFQGKPAEFAVPRGG